ncbi:capsular polysaccharide biosynthesis protein [Microbulbifer sp. 2205BS26-8]|uniref:capsular polysaccharide biosynthesis protein n=1 Tax=Microbulbifer sp. 2205BS26-8 TaxID=3064386 RepID=UPI00273FD63C|nr:capsular polysaccharide biosynthesis protein [Microbulbifer sp. 2205BS26-8]MDP5211232.1 capsular polysaccharide biosynthesis protein [Microbulbifer sp. 2205BS26-8]
MPVVGYCSLGLRRLKNLDQFLRAQCRYIPFYPGNEITHMVGWGLKDTAIKAKKIANKYHLPYICIEDGFLRSLGLGVEGSLPHSLVVDNTGIYYDATQASDLENLIKEADFSQEDIKRANRGIELLKHYRLSKYNNSADLPVSWASKQKRVLVVDQTYNDISVQAGYGSRQQFYTMLDSAIRENPHAEICVKIHPDVIAGKKKGYLLGQAHKQGCRVITEDISPWALFDDIEKVYVVTSQLGFDALIAGKEVHCFGIPFYAGWGLTKDRQKLNRRNVSRSLAQVFFAAYYLYCRYINPYTGRSCKFEDTVRLITEQKRTLSHLNGRWVGVGFSSWKRRFIADFLGRRKNIQFISNFQKIHKATEGVNALVWASSVTEELRNNCEKSGLNLWQAEDGFLRSVGLGADLVAPISLVFDARGIYFDAHCSSDLEILLNKKEFSLTLINRAKKLQKMILEKGISKYNVGSSGGLDSFSFPRDRKIILVPGQVESDASIAFGSPSIKSNQSLLKKVRSENPDAYILYKPHPDVEVGARLGALQPDSEAVYDRLIQNIEMSVLLKQVNEVHTLSSLTGFEALLRGLKVVTYGLPFYAGWGLTDDKLLTGEVLADIDLEAFKARRIRRLTLDELIAGTLILYPFYIDPSSGEYIDVETAVELLDNNRNTTGPAGVVQKIYRWYRNKYLFK